MAPHSSTPPWKIPWIEEPGRLQFMRSQRVGHDWVTFTKLPQMVTAAMKLKDTWSLEEKYDKPRQHIKKQRHYFANKGPSSQSYFSSSHVWMWQLDHKESWVSKNWCFWTVVLEKTLESTLDCKEIQPVHPKGDQSWVFIGRTDVEAETPILWPPDVTSWLIWKDPDAGKDWEQEKKRMTEDEMVGWYHRLDRHGFGWTPGVCDGHGGLVCCDSWGRKESDTTERLIWMPMLLKPFQKNCRGRNTFKLMSIESVMLSNHLILFCPFLLLPSVFPSIRIFSKELAIRIR